MIEALAFVSDPVSSSMLSLREGCLGALANSSNDEDRFVCPGAG